MQKILSLPKFFWDIINKNPELKKIIANMNWLFLDRIIQMAVAFFVGVWVIRYLGPGKYGVLSYVVALTVLFGILSKLGLEAILVRDLVDNKIEKEKLLGTAFLIKLSGAFIATVLSILAVFFTRGNDMLVVFLALIISLSLVFQSFEVIDYWFQSQIKSKFVAYSRSFASVIGGLIKIGLILVGAPLIYFASVILLESILFTVGLMYAYIKNKQSLMSWKFDFPVAKQLFRDSWPLVLASISVVVYMKIDQIMIGSMLNKELLGNYSAAVALSEMWYFIPMIVTSSVFPAILYAKRQSRELYLKRLQILYDSFVWFTLLVASIVSFLAPFIIRILYGTEYSEAANVLTIHIWTGVFVFLGVASSQYLIAENLTKISLYRTVIGAIINITLNLVLIPSYGIIGAAIATSTSYVFATLSIVFFRSARINFFMFINALNIFRIIKELNKKNNEID